MMVTGVGREERRHFTGRRRRGVDWPSSHRPTVLSLAVLFVGGGIHAIALAAPAHADAVAAVMAKTQRMSEPSLTSQQDGWYNQGDKLTLNCFKRGQAVKGHFSFNIPNGGWDNLWYKVSDGRFVADVDIETGTLSTVTPECDQAPAPQASGAPGASLATKVDNFVAATNGDKVGDGQCVPLIKQYLSDVYGIQPGSWGNAIDYRQGGSAGNQLESRGFSWHTDRQFNNGDILVWQQDSRFAYLPQGHIAVGYNGKIYDQNYAGRLTAGSDPFSGYGYLGYWRKAL